MSNWKETKCGKCKIQRAKPICNTCEGYNKFVPMTNAERIQTMSIEELAEFIAGLNEHCLAGIGKVDCSTCNGYCEDYCAKMTKEWLQSEVED